MTDQLKLYNAALIEIGERELADLNDTAEARHVLDRVWDSGTLVEYLLLQGQWNFATRTSELTFNPSIGPGFGYQYAFNKPDDWVKTSALSSEGHFNSPLNKYADEAGYWFCDHQNIYVRYVSSDSQYGKDFSLWTPSFTRWVEVYLASRICERLTQNATKAKSLKDAADPESIRPTLLLAAKSNDAMDEPTKFPPRGGWTRSRTDGRHDRSGSDYY